MRMDFPRATIPRPIFACLRQLPAPPHRHAKAPSSQALSTTPTRSPGFSSTSRRARTQCTARQKRREWQTRAGAKAQNGSSGSARRGRRPRQADSLTLMAAQLLLLLFLREIARGSMPTAPRRFLRPLCRSSTRLPRRAQEASSFELNGVPPPRAFSCPATRWRRAANAFWRR